MILDASAVIAVFAEEPDADWLAPLLYNNEQKWMSTVNAAEVLLFLERSKTATPIEGLRELRLLRLELVAPDPKAIVLVAESRARFTISFGDRFCYALHKLRGEPILTLDRDFEKTDAVLVPRPQDQNENGRKIDSEA